MKRIITNIFIGLAIAFSLCCFPSCKNETLTIEQIMDIGGAGSFYAINLNANDTVETGGGIKIGVSYPILNATNGDEIKLLFIPNSEYVKYSFDVSYLLPDSSSVECKDKDYTYILKTDNFEAGSYTISMYAESTKQLISSSGKVYLMISE